MIPEAPSWQCISEGVLRIVGYCSSTSSPGVSKFEQEGGKNGQRESTFLLAKSQLP